MTASRASCGRRGCLGGCLGLLASLFIVLGLTYWGYCWGWWGRTNLTLQYLFQCQCPVASEAVRYRPFIVLASACTQPEVIDLAPSGRFLIFRENVPFQHIQRTDLITYQTRTLPLEAATIWYITQLDDHRLLINRSAAGFQYMLLDLYDGTRVDLPFVSTMTLEAAAIQVMQQAEQVWVLPVEVLALAPDYNHNPAQSLVFFSASTAPQWQAQVNQQLDAAGIAYQLRSLPYTTGRRLQAYYSRDGRFWADAQGIALAATDARIVPVTLPRNAPAAAFRPYGWTPDNRGVVYAANALGYLIDWNYPPWQLFPVPQPILLVEVPEAYWE